MDRIHIYDLNDDELERLAVKLDGFNKVETLATLLVKLRAELKHRQRLSYTKNEFPMEVSTFNYIDSIACGFCPECGREGTLEKNKLNWPDTDEEIIIVCPLGHKSEIYHGRNGDWS